MYVYQTYVCLLSGLPKAPCCLLARWSLKLQLSSFIFLRCTIVCVTIYALWFELCGVVLESFVVERSPVLAYGFMESNGVGDGWENKWSSSLAWSFWALWPFNLKTISHVVLSAWWCCRIECRLRRAPQIDGFGLAPAEAQANPSHIRSPGIVSRPVWCMGVTRMRTMACQSTGCRNSLCVLRYPVEKECFAQLINGQQWGEQAFPFTLRSSLLVANN